MPCVSNYLEPTQKEKNTKEAAELIMFVNGRLGIPTPKNIIRSTTDLYGKGASLKKMVPMLCDKLSGMNKRLSDLIIYNGKDPMSRRLAEWWDKHQEADAKRLREELKAKKDGEARKKAIAKLTARERKLLGLP